jgi:type IV pilus assembly protein PilP
MVMVRHGLLVVCLAIAGSIGILWDRSDAQPAPISPAASAPSAQPGTAANRAGQPSAPGGSSVPPVASTPPASQTIGAGTAAEPVVPTGRSGYVYLPEGRRDPFLSILQEAGSETAKKMDEANLPPLQRVTVAELSVIGIVWGGFGYMAMVQAPDGRGYAVQRGARIGNNNGIVSAITEKAVIVEERFTDIYGKKQVREYAKPLHTKEGLP